MTTPQGVAAARAHAVVARHRLITTAGQLKERLSPATLASSVVERVRDGAETAVHDGLSVAKRRPGTVAAGAGTILLLLVGGRLLRRRRDRRQHTDGNAVDPLSVNHPAEGPSKGRSA